MTLRAASLIGLTILGACRQPTDSSDQRAMQAAVLKVSAHRPASSTVCVGFLPSPIFPPHSLPEVEALLARDRVTDPSRRFLAALRAAEPITFAPSSSCPISGAPGIRVFVSAPSPRNTGLSDVTCVVREGSATRALLRHVSLTGGVRVTGEQDLWSSFVQPALPSVAH
jgi:hypothetical protein